MDVFLESRLRLRLPQFRQHHVRVFRNVRPERPHHEVHNERISLAQEPANSSALGIPGAHFLLHVGQQPVQGVPDDRPEASPIRRFQIQRVDLRLQNGHYFFHPAVRIQQPITHVADLSQLRPEPAPRGKPVDGKPREHNRNGEQKHAGDEPEIKLQLRIRVGLRGNNVFGTGHKSPVKVTLWDGTDYKPSRSGDSPDLIKPPTPRRLRGTPNTLNIDEDGEG